MVIYSLEEKNSEFYPLRNLPSQITHDGSMGLEFFYLLHIPNMFLAKCMHIIPYAYTIIPYMSHEKNPALLSIESWMVNDGILISWFMK